MTPGGGAEGAGAGFVSACRLVWVEGPDAEGFLHGLLTADLRGMADGEVRPALLLTAKGHLLSRMRVVREAEGSYALVADPAPAADPTPALQAHHVSEDLEVLGPEDAEVAVLVGVDRARAAATGDLVLDGLVPGTVEVVTGDARAAIAALGVPEAGPEALEALRVAAGVPRVGVDTGGATLVQEAGLEGWVSFEKGCYLGQETVARLHYRGHANRTLRGLELAAPVGAGALVRAGEREVGRVTSVAPGAAGRARGLATLRREVAPGDTVAVEGLPSPARVVALPFPG